VLPIEGPVRKPLPDEFMGVNENRTEALSYECGIDRSVE
jgi:hypothetical protein